MLEREVEMIADGFKRCPWTNVALAERPDLSSRSIRTRIRLRELSVAPSPQQFLRLCGARFLPSFCGLADRREAGASDGDINSGHAVAASNSMVQNNHRPKPFGNLGTAVGVSRNSGDAVRTVTEAAQRKAFSESRPRSSALVPHLRDREGCGKKAGQKPV